MLWQVEDRIPNISSRVLGPGPCFKSWIRGGFWNMAKVCWYTTAMRSLTRRIRYIAVVKNRCSTTQNTHALS